ncbi:hypothetical protein [Nocardiopsis trehalosi]|jgi:hypothetical protein|uniref:hypothetical protein n=1 Tax=Nocardiopsis trehalosi TaxID=109329 RepID=UPI0008378BFE|nr:hypothetical protein [Nocardiopsis trehalosi]
MPQDDDRRGTPERDAPGHEPRHPRDREFAPVLKDDDERQGSDDTRDAGRKATGTGVPTDVPAEEGDTTARSSDEGPPIGGSAHEDEPRP